MPILSIVHKDTQKQKDISGDIRFRRDHLLFEAAVNEASFTPQGGTEGFPRGEAVAAARR